MDRVMTSDLTHISPPVAVSGLVVGGLELNDIVLILTIIYTLLLIIKNIPQVYKVLDDWSAKIKGKCRRETDKENKDEH